MKKFLFGILLASLGIIFAVHNRTNLSFGADTGQENYVLHTSPEFSFDYPSSWHVEDTPVGVSSFVLTTLLNYDESDPKLEEKIDSLAKITIAKIPKDANTPFANWLEKYIARGQDDWGSDVLEEKSTSVDDSNAVFHIEQLGDLASPVMYIDKGTAVYIIIGGAYDKTLNDVFYKVVDGFKFK